MKIYYFTGTGNSLWIAKGLTDNLVSIPHIDFENGFIAEDDDAIGIVCPIYGFSTPHMVEEFIRKTTFKTPYLFVIGAYGDRYGKFPERVMKMFEGDRKPDYIDCIKMVDNAVHAGYEIGNQIETLPEKHVEEHYAAVKNDIEKRVHSILNSANPFLSALVYAAEPLTYKHVGNKVLSVDGNACIKCGMCTKVCPKKNITLDGNVQIGSSCELCLSCLHNCPKQAIHIKREKSSVRYRNSEITLKEIIDSNSQM